MAKLLKRVFLSSTGRDLHAHREAVALAINRLDGFHCVRMEDFLARNRSPREHCQDAVESSDIYVGLFGRLYGSLVPQEKVSYTEMEYDTALTLDRPRLLFLADDDFQLPESLYKDALKGLKAREIFHKKSKADRLTGRFGASDVAIAALAEHVSTSLANLQLEKQAPVRKGRSPLTLHAPKLADVEREYLAFLAERYQFLDFKGMGVTDKLPVKLALRDLYVPLQVRPSVPEGQKGGLEGLRLAGRTMTEAEREVAGGIGQPVSALELLQKEAGVVLLGDPGAGKSTFLKYLALELADPRGEGLGLPGRLPFLVPIAGYAEALSLGPARLDNFITGDFRDRVGDLGVGALLAAALAAGRALLLLDGLDEVRDRKLQKRVVARVQDFFALHARKGNKFVITSRLVGYHEVRPTAKGLVEATLLDFEQDEIEAFLGKWVAVQERAVLGETRHAAGSAEKEGRELLEALRLNPAVQSLAANPLLLTILALMKRQGVTLPEQRAKLYDNYVRTLLETWNTARSMTGEALAERSATDLLKVLGPLALWIHESSPGVGLVRESDLLMRLEAIYREERGLADPETARVAAEAFLRDVNDSCLLLARGAGLYGFIHLTFLEYLAGRALAKLDQPDRGREPLLDAIFARVGEPTWREVLLLAIGHLGVVEEREASAGHVLASLVELRPGTPGEAEALAGQALADLGFAGVHPEVRGKVMAALLAVVRDDGRVAAPQRAAVGEALAAVGDPRPEVMTLSGMQLCWVPPGPFLMGSVEDDEEAVDREKPQHEVEIPYGYWLGRFPVTVAQFDEYLEVAQEKPGHEAVLAGPANAPVIAVTWYETLAFCRWLSGKGTAEGWLPPGWSVTLPSEAEWEKAARGGLRLAVSPVVAGWDGLCVSGPAASLENPAPGRRYPWNGEEDPNRASYDKTGLRRVSAVGCFPGGVSPVGCEELSGNVWEWTRSQLKDYPYVASDGREDLQVSEDTSLVLRGGSCFNDSRYVRCALRFRYFPYVRSGYIGFRLVVRPF